MVTVGVPLTTDQYSEDPIFWDILEIDNSKKGNDIETHQVALQQVFSHFFKRRDVVFRSLTEDNKGFIFDPLVTYTKRYLEGEQVSDEKFQNKYYLKKQLESMRDSDKAKVSITIKTEDSIPNETDFD